jgi:hypothetical protein
VPPVTTEEIIAYDLQHTERMRVERGVVGRPGCYLSWPEGTDVPPRPDFGDTGFSAVLAAADRGDAD